MPPRPVNSTPVPRTRPIRDSVGLDTFGVFKNLPTKNLASSIQYLFAQNDALSQRLTAIEDQVKQKNETIQHLTKQLGEREVSKGSLDRWFKTFEANQQHISDELKSLVHRLDNVNDRQIKDEDRNANEFRKIGNRLEHLSFCQTEYENVQSNVNDYKELEKRFEKHLSLLDREYEHWTKEFKKLARGLREVEKDLVKEERRLKELDKRQHDFNSAQSMTNEELRGYQQEIHSVQKKCDDELQRRLQELQTSQQNSVQELESRWQGYRDLWQALSDEQTLVSRLQQEQEHAHEKCNEEIGRWQQQLQSMQGDWQRLEHEIDSTQGKRDEESAERFQKIQGAQELLSEKLEKDLKEVQSVWKRSADKDEKRWHDFETAYDRLRENCQKCQQDIDSVSMQEKWRSFECDQGNRNVAAAQEKCNSELLERQQQLQVQLQTCNRELEKHQANQEIWNSMSDQHQQELESKQEKDITELKERQLDNQFSVEKCIKKLTNQQAELVNINVMFTTIKECSQKLNELNVKTKGITHSRQVSLVETSRESPRLQIERPPLPPSPTPSKNLESRKREFITPPVSVFNGSSRSTNAPKKSNEEYREEARANSHLQRFGTPSVSSLTSRREMTPSTPTVSASANKDTRSGNGNNTRPSSVGSQVRTAPRIRTPAFLERMGVSPVSKQVSDAISKKRQSSREIAPPAKRIMTSTEVTSAGRSGRSSTADSSTTANQPKPNSNNAPVVKKGTAVPLSKAQATNSSPTNNNVSKEVSGSSSKSNIAGLSPEVVITSKNASTDDMEQVEKPAHPVIETGIAKQGSNIKR